jgi:hypothetical protein
MKQPTPTICIAINWPMKPCIAWTITNGEPNTKTW